MLKYGVWISAVHIQLNMAQVGFFNHLVAEVNTAGMFSQQAVDRLASITSMKCDIWEILAIWPAFYVNSCFEDKGSFLSINIVCMHSTHRHLMCMC